MYGAKKSVCPYPLFIVVAAVTVLTRAGLAAQSAGDSRADELARISRDADAVLGLERSAAFQLAERPVPVGPVAVQVPVEGLSLTLDLTPHSVRAAGFTVRAQVADGSYIAVEPGPARTLRGTVAGLEGSAVAASWLEDGLYARIILPNDEQYWVEPLAGRVPGALAGDHVIYHDDDVAHDHGTCIVVADGAGEETLEPLHSIAGAGSGFAVAELGIDADVEFFQRYGTVSATVDQIESVINSMNIQYERDTAIRHDIVHVIVRTSEPDPYSSTSPSTLLNEFRNHWISAQGGVQRDVAQLFTGKNIDGNVIGIAFLSGICSESTGYGVVESDFTSNFACKTDLSAHELGHNWSAGHCTCSGWTMNPNITCANRFHPDFTIPGILSFRATRSCLDFEGGGSCVIADPPVVESDVSVQNRYLPFAAPPSVGLAAARVTFEELPPPFDAWNGVAMWVGLPREVSLAPDKNDGTSPTFLSAPLQCDPAIFNFSGLGTIHLYHPGIVPGGRYAVQMVDARCSVFDSDNFSFPLFVQSARWGDVAGAFDTSVGAWGAPDGNATVGSDVIALIDGLRGIPAAPVKPRLDLVPATPDRLVTIFDVLAGIDAALGKAFPFSPGARPCD